MEVIVAGVNVDRSLIDKVRRGESVDDEAWTPETLSASYARISRSPLAITELREQARAEIERARKSNETIVFGMGHNSIAEHAVFNFDILDVPVKSQQCPVRNLHKGLLSRVVGRAIGPWH